MISLSCIDDGPFKQFYKTNKKVLWFSKTTKTGTEKKSLNSPAIREIKVVTKRVPLVLSDVGTHNYYRCNSNKDKRRDEKQCRKARVGRPFRCRSLARDSNHRLPRSRHTTRLRLRISACVIKVWLLAFVKHDTPSS